MVKFFDSPFDAGTRRKLKIFELYTQEWIPVFLAPKNPKFSEVHIFDFFCGPGTDMQGEPGSPLRILAQLREYHKKGLKGWDKVRIKVHFSDASGLKISALESTLASGNWRIPNVEITVKKYSFEEALSDSLRIFQNRNIAKLLIIDQYGVDAVSDEVFKRIIRFPRSDFIFFLSSSILHRFRSLPIIKQKIPEPQDSYHVHRAAFNYYKGLIPHGNEIYLGQFSIRKGSNIYGLIFGSRHPLGIYKFLQVAWKNDQLRGEANFDVDRDNMNESQMLLDLTVMRPKKVQDFERKLKAAFLSERFKDEVDVMKFCFESGMTPKHVATVLSALKKEKKVECDFISPNIRKLKSPRPVTYLGTKKIINKT